MLSGSRHFSNHFSNHFSHRKQRPKLLKYTLCYLYNLFIILKIKNSKRGDGGVGFLIRECLLAEVEFISACVEFEMVATF